jgi:tetratricopeptide (TPR) repeat protein
MLQHALPSSKTLPDFRDDLGRRYYGIGTAFMPETPRTAAVYQTGVGSAAGLIAEGDVARGQRRFDQAKELYEKAANATGRGPQAATALIRLGEIDLRMKEYQKAIGDFERAEAADSGKASDARMWTAIAEQNQNNLETAAAEYQRALSAEDPNSASAAAIIELYAKLLRQQGREDEAKKC